MCHVPPTRRDGIVNLRGQEAQVILRADLAYWQDRLREEKLARAERDGQAQVVVSAAQLKHWGVRFCEVSFSVQVRPVERFDPAKHGLSDWSVQLASDVPLCRANLFLADVPLRGRASLGFVARLRSHL